MTSKYLKKCQKSARLATNWCRLKFSDGLRSLHRWSSLLAIGLACITLILIGSSLCLSGRFECTLDGCTDVVYESAQVLWLNMDPHYKDEINTSVSALKLSSTPKKLTGSAWWSSVLLSCGRITAVLFVLVVSLQVLGKFFGDSWHLFWLSRKKNHHIICGLGQIGWQLVQKLHRQGKKVVVVEIREDHPRIPALHDLPGVMLVTGDATEKRILKQVRAQYAAAIYAMTGNDTANLEITHDFNSLRKELKEANKPLEVQNVYLNLNEQALSQSVTSTLHVDDDKRLHHKIVNLLAHTSRSLIIEHLAADRLRPQQADEVGLYFLIGFGQMGQNLALQLAQFCHFENERRPRLVIVTDNSRETANRFLAAWGQFSPTVVETDWQQIAFNPTHDEWKHHADARPEEAYHVNDEQAIEYACNAVFTRGPEHFSDRAFGEMIKRLSSQPGVKPALIVCTDNEQENFTIANTLWREIQTIQNLAIPTFAWLPTQTPLNELLKRQNRLDPTGQVKEKEPAGIKEPHVSLVPFGNYQSTDLLSELTEPLIQEIEKVIFASYHDLNYRENPAVVNKKWDEDLENYRQSNRSAAVHALIKMKCLGVSMNFRGFEDHQRDNKFPELNDDLLDRLSRMEHYRWTADRLLAGYQYNEVKSNHPPRRPQICHWDHLPEKERQKDVLQIKAVYQFLKNMWENPDNE